MEREDEYMNTQDDRCKIRSGFGIHPNVNLNRASKIIDDIVMAKAGAAAIWSAHATVYAKTYGDKPWTYLLIPHDQIFEQMSLAGLAARCTYVSQVQATGSHGKE